MKIMSKRVRKLDQTILKNQMVIILGLKYQFQYQNFNFTDISIKYQYQQIIL